MFGLILVGLVRGAEIDATLDENGSISGFNIPAGKGGSGYNAATNLTIVPIIRAIGYGQTAEVVMDTESEFNATTGLNEFVSNSFRLDTGFAGEPRGGSGYVIAPIFRSVTAEGNLVSWTQNGKSFNRLPFEETNGSSSSVAQFELGPDGAQMIDHIVLGGFTHSPILFNFEVNQTNETIETVYFIVDGRVEEQKEEGPFVFTMIPHEPKDYTVYALVRDTAGNLSASEEIVLSAEQFTGGGVSVALNMERGMTVESNSTILLSADASSEFGVAEVEFFLDSESLGVVKPLIDANNYSFIQAVNLEDVVQGEHTISVIARDKAGNQAGTFYSRQTNIPARQNQSLQLYLLSHPLNAPLSPSLDRKPNFPPLIYPPFASSPVRTIPTAISKVSVFM